MANLPDSLYEDYTQLKYTWSYGSTSAAPPNLGTMFRWINDLQSPFPAISDFALQNLVTNMNSFEILPVMLWESTGTVAMMLREVLQAYERIRYQVYAQFIIHRVYNFLLLFQCIAHHPKTRAKFLKARMPHYFYPLMEIRYIDKSTECIRLGALGVIAHLLKAPLDKSAVRFLMDSGAFRHCTKPIEIGSSESKTIAVFILSKILSTDEGLQYCCILADRFFAIDDLLKNLLVYLASMPKPSSSLFNLVTACYAKLSQKSRARNGLRRYIPVMLFDGTFASLLSEDPEADNHRKQLIQNLESKR